MTADVTPAARAMSFIAREYDILPSAVAAVGGGVESEVWRLERGDAPSLCLKWFRGQDRALVERTSVIMDWLARRGLPFPRLHRTRLRDAVATFEGRAVIVLDWIEGYMLDAFGETTAQAVAVSLADMHDALAEYETPVAAAPSWQTCDVEDVIDRCLRIRGHIQRLDERSPIDDLIDNALTDRIRDLKRVDGLRKALPAMVTELLHSDYTRPNLLFQGTNLVGILDLKGVPGYAVWELGKVAFDPRTFVSRRDWLDIALAAISAYQSRRKRADIVAAARTTLIYHLCSLWGISDRYDGGLRAVPTGYEEYWLDRHALTGGLLEALEELEAVLPSC
jgi:homoserine kinase type II